MKSILFLVFVATTFAAHATKSKASENGTRFRGTMINPLSSEDDFRVLASWKANLIRWQLVWYGNDPASTANCSQFQAWLLTALQHFDSMLPLLRELNLHIILDLHTTPGGAHDQQDHYRLFTDEEFQDCLLSAWETMANRYKNERQIIAYDLLNEPDDRYLAPGLLSWRDLAIATIQRIRSIDSAHPILFEGSPGAMPNTLPNFVPLPFEQIIYSIHMYEPYEFTMQNINTNDTPLYYPGMIGQTMWNKAQLRAVLQPNVDWQNRYNTSILIGEFSAIRWAPGNSTVNYLSDLIELYEEFGWDWDYHAFREFQGWDTEMIGDKDHPQRSPVPTDRQLLLMKWFEKNTF